MNFYRLEADVEAFPILEIAGSSSVEEEGLISKHLPLMTRCESVKHRWPRLRVKIVSGPASRGRATDCPYLPLGIVLTSRACDALSPLLLPNGELLPLECKAEPFHLLHVTKVVDAIDMDHSTFTYTFDERWRPQREDVTRLALSATRLEGVDLFRVPGLLVPSYDVYVSQSFVDAVADAGLQGFSFEQVAPAEVHRHEAWVPDNSFALESVEVTTDRDLTAEEHREVQAWLDSEPGQSGAGQTGSALRAIGDRIGVLRSRRKDQAWEREVLALGATYGQVLCDGLNWRWRHVTCESEGRVLSGYAVVAPCRQFVIFPFVLMRHAVEDRARCDEACCQALYDWLRDDEDPLDADSWELIG